MPALRKMALPTTYPRPRSTPAPGRSRGSRGGRPQHYLTHDQRQSASKATLHYGQTQAWKARHHDGYRIISLFAGTGGGKALMLNTRIPTPSGWTTMGEMRVGDQVFDETGRPCTVTYATEIMEGHTCYDVVLSDGSIITADADHLWLTWTYAARKGVSRRIQRPPRRRLSPQTTPSALPTAVTTEQIRATLRHRIGDVERANHAIRLADPLQLPEADLPIDPYVLGVWLGDGTGLDAVITTADPEVLTRIEQAGYNVSPATERREGFAPQYRIGSAPRQRDPRTGRAMPNNSLKSRLATLGLIGNKHVPPVYLRASQAQREALLMGLMDTDGTADKDGGCAFDNTNEGLAAAVAELAVSLGYKVTCATKRATYRGQDFGPVYRVTFTPHRPVFRLTRKLARQALDQVRQTQYWRYIVDVRERPSVPVRCITVDSPRHLYLAGESMTPTHNTWFGPRFWYPEIQKNPRASFLFVEPTWRHVKRVMVPMIEEFFGAYNLGRMHYGDMVYELYSGGRIIFGSVDNPNSLQGVHIDGGIWGDEVGLFSEEAWDVLLQRAALHRAPILATSTPYTLPWCEKRLAVPAQESTRHGDKEYWIIQFPSYWNPMYPHDQYFRLKRTWPRDKFDRLMRGLFTRIGGLMFEEIKEDRNLADIWPIEGTREFPWRIHFKHPKEGERDVNLVRTWGGQDWGWNDPGCQLLAGEDGMGRIYVFEEDYDSMIPVERGTDEGADTWVSRAMRRVNRWGMEVLWCDPSMPGYINDMRAHGVNAMPANNKVRFGSERVNQAMLAQGDGGGGCYIARSGCPNLVRTYGTYVRKKGKAEDEYLDEPADNQEDHPEDCLRYMIVGDAKLEEGPPSDVPGLILSFPSDGRRTGPNSRR